MSRFKAGQRLVVKRQHKSFFFNELNPDLKDQSDFTVQRVIGPLSTAPSAAWEMVEIQATSGKAYQFSTDWFEPT